MTRDKVAKYVLGELTLKDVFDEYDKLFIKFEKKHFKNNRRPKGVGCYMDVYFNEEFCEDWYEYSLKNGGETILSLTNDEGTMAEIPMSTKVKFDNDIIVFDHEDCDNEIKIKFRMVYTKHQKPKNPFVLK